MTSVDPATAAWRVPKDGLVRALIVGEEMHTQAEEILFECPGYEYVSCSGEVYAKMPAFFSEASVNPNSWLYGVSFTLRTEYVTVLKTGAILRRPLTVEEMTFPKFEHRAGASL